MFFIFERSPLRTCELIVDFLIQHFNLLHQAINFVLVIFGQVLLILYKIFFFINQIKGSLNRSLLSYNPNHVFLFFVRDFPASMILDELLVVINILLNILEVHVFSFQTLFLACDLSFVHKDGVDVSFFCSCFDFFLKFINFSLFFINIFLVESFSLLSLLASKVMGINNSLVLSALELLSLFALSLNFKSCCVNGPN